MKIELGEIGCESPYWIFFKILVNKITFSESLQLSREYNVSTNAFVRETIEYGKSRPANKERRKEETIDDMGRQSYVRLFRVSGPAKPHSARLVL
jgi:hypothetical protein